MRKILLAIGSSAAEDRLKNNRELASEYSFTNIATHKDSILTIAKKEKPDVILIKENLGGNADILSIIFALRSDVPNARIIFMTSPKNPGDSLMNSLVSCGVYDILADSRFSIVSIVEAIKNPKTFGDVSQYIISSDMQKMMNSHVEKEYVSTAKDMFNNQSKFQPHKEVDRSEPQEFGYLKVDDGQGKKNQDYSPILSVNKGTAGKSFKPMTSKPDVSKIDEIILDDDYDELLFDDKEVVVENEPVLIETKPEPKKEIKIEKVAQEVKPVVEKNKVEELKVNVSRETINEEVISTYTPPTGNNSFIKNNRQFNDVSSKIEKVELEKSEDIKKEPKVEEIQFIKNTNAKQETKALKPEPKKEIVIKEEKVVEQKINKEVVSKVVNNNDTTENELELLQTKEVKKEEPIIKKEAVKVDTNKATRIYSFVKYFEFSENHASLNTALALAQTYKVLFLLVNSEKRNVVEVFVDSIADTTWYNPYKENLTFNKISKYELISVLNDSSEYDYILVDTFYDKDFEVILDKVSTSVLHVAAQQKPLFDFIHKLDCRKDVAVMVNYKNELISAKSIMKEGQFGTVVKVPDTDVEDFNAINSKVPSMGRKNNAKTLKDYETLLNVLREDK